jgi:hypothetical protein
VLASNYALLRTVVVDGFVVFVARVIPFTITWLTRTIPPEYAQATSVLVRILTRSSLPHHTTRLNLTPSPTLGCLLQAAFLFKKAGTPDHASAAWSF